MNTVKWEKEVLFKYKTQLTFEPYCLLISLLPEA